MNKNGYTIIELIMAMSLFLIVLIGSTAIFYRSFRSSGVSDVQMAVNTGLRSLEGVLEKTIRFGEVEGVINAPQTFDREDCLAAGEAGVYGDTLIISDVSGNEIIYLLSEEGAVSSNSASISNPKIWITDLLFTWTCRSGVNDKIKLDMKAVYGDITIEVIEGSISKDINLLNSGVN